MKKFIVGLLPLVVSMVAVTSAWNITGYYVTEQPACNKSESKTIDVYMTWDTYTIYPYDAYWNNESDVLMNNKTSVQIRSGGYISNCDDWTLMSNYIKKGHPSNEKDRTLVLRTEGDKGCILHKPTTVRKDSSSIDATIHYTLGFKKKGSDGSLDWKFYYRTVDDIKYNCLGGDWKYTQKDKVSECANITVWYDADQQYHVWECLNYRIFRCGDGILDKTHEQCDPQDPNHTWWWDGWCDPSCKPNNWKLKVEKTLIWSKEIQNVGDIVEWKIKVTAEGSDMSNFDIVDDLTNAPVLAYSGYEIMHKGSVDTITFGWENKATHRVLWYVKWTLKQNDYIEIKVITYAKQMPDKEYKNIACVKINGKEDCDDELVPSPKLRIKKSFTDWTKQKTVKIWDEIWYKITFGNSWTAAATITSIKDFLPMNVQYKSSKIYIVAWNNSNTIQEGVFVDIYGWITLQPHTEWYIILTGVVLWEYTGSTQNWACIYLNDTKIDCDDAIHNVDGWICKSLGITTRNFTYQWGSTSVVCEASSAKADSIEIDCGNGTAIKWVGVGSLDGRCSYSANNSSSTKSYSVTCKVNGVSADNCKWTVTVGTHNPPPPDHAICKKIDYDNGYAVCYSTNSKAHFKLACDGETYYYEDSRERSHKFKECKNPEYAKCYVKGDDDTMWKTNDDCTDGEPEPFDSVNEQCFNVNAWNFSIEEWEIFPFYWNMRNVRNEPWVAEGNYTEIKGNYQNAISIYNEYAWKSCSQAWSVAKDSMICEFNIYDGDVYHKWMQDWEEKDNPLYTIQWPCLSAKPVMETNSLIKAWYDEMVDTYCNNPKNCEFYDDAELPTAVYYIKWFWTNASVHLNVGKWEWNWELQKKKNSESKKSYGEYKIELSNVKYLQCGEDKKWKQTTPDIWPCQGNFTLTTSYTVQKTPSGNLKASTEKLSKFLSYNGGSSFGSLLNAIQATEYKPNSKVEDAMDSFIKKYEKLAVKVDLNGNKFLEGTNVSKVPGKQIYFVDGDLTINWWRENITTPFTIVQTKWNTTIDGDIGHNMMLLTKGNITFIWDCKSDQEVKWIYYAKGNLIREWVAKNDDTSHTFWCTNGWLHVKWVLIGNNFEELMKKSRSNLNNWFKADSDDKKRKLIMNGASVVIEYSTSIFTKSTMSPGAEDFTTALSIYKN